MMNIYIYVWPPVRRMIHVGPGTDTGAMCPTWPRRRRTPHSLSFAVKSTARRGPETMWRILLMAALCSSNVLHDFEEERPCISWVKNFETGKCYMLFCKERTYEEAEKVCVKLGGHLATVCNERINEFLGLMTLIYKKSVWIGLEKRKKDASVTPNAQDWKWTSGETCRFTQWTSYGNNPDNYAGNEHCVQYWTGESTEYYNAWNDVWCGATFPYFCERSCDV